jgi:hypothetical protein
LRLHITKRRQRAFKVLGLTWIVERTFAWLARNRRLSKDYELKVQTSEAFIDLAAIRLMLKRLCPEVKLLKHPLISANLGDTCVRLNGSCPWTDTQGHPADCLRPVSPSVESVSTKFPRCGWQLPRLVRNSPILGDDFQATPFGSVSNKTGR